MPYVKPEVRDEVEQSLKYLIEAMKVATDGDDKAMAGLLNYVCTSLALGVIPEERYWCIALYSGVFHNIADEFYRRFAAPYEDKQIAKNGDVYGTKGTD